MDQLDKKYYRIADVSALLDLPASTLRFWEKEFGDLHPKRNSGGQRLYTPADIEKLRIIRFLVKDKGLTIEGAREHLKASMKNVDKTHHVISRLNDIRRRITSLIDALDERQRQLRKI